MSCLERKRMKRFYDKGLIETCLKQTKFEPVMSGLREHLFAVQYEKRENGQEDLGNQKLEIHNR